MTSHRAAATLHSAAHQTQHHDDIHTVEHQTTCAIHVGRCGCRVECGCDACEEEEGGDEDVFQSCDGVARLTTDGTDDLDSTCTRVRVMHARFAAGGFVVVLRSNDVLDVSQPCCVAVVCVLVVAAHLDPIHHHDGRRTETHRGGLHICTHRQRECETYVMHSSYAYACA